MGTISRSSSSATTKLERAEYNILDMSASGLAAACPAIQQASAALRPDYLPAFPSSSSSPPLPHDIMDWLGGQFGFQQDNVRNQREHVVLLLANHLLRTKQEVGSHGHGHASHNDARQVHGSIAFLHSKLLENYRKWCSFLGEKPEDHHLVFRLVYPCLYLLIWGEASNLRFMPECLCYIFHHMAGSANKTLKGDDDLEEGNGPADFLEDIITPIYRAVSSESKGSMNGKAPHSSWRNYDDMNEFFWTRHCFSQLGWPLNRRSDYLECVPSMWQRPGPAEKRDKSWFSAHCKKEQWRRKARRSKRMGFKAGFVEQRSFWNIFHSFPRLWIAQLLLLQTLIMLAFVGDGEWPWRSVLNRDNQVKLLYAFVTWAGLLTLQAFLTIVMQFTLLSRSTKLLALRMALKLLTSMGWTAIFSIMIARIEEQRARDRPTAQWSQQSNLVLFQFLEAVGIFLLPEIMATILFFMPPIANLIENSDCIPVRILSWWFSTRTFVGRGLHQDLFATLKYTLFWIVILTAKISFSYAVQIRQLIEPTHDLLGLKNVPYEWYVFFRTGNMFEVFLLWAPVLLIYLMDIQIWYSIFSSIFGVVAGLCSHIGDIRNMQQLRLRFPFFASAVTFNILADTAIASSQQQQQQQRMHRHSWKLHDMVRRLSIRYGFDKNYQRPTGSHELEFQRFAELWNHVIRLLREEDLLSNMEREALSIPQSRADIPCAQWPLAFLSNEVSKALRIAMAWKDEDAKKLWKKIRKEEYRELAVIEVLATVKYILLELVHGDCRKAVETKVIRPIQEHCEKGELEFLPQFRGKEVKRVHSHVVSLLEALLRYKESLQGREGKAIDVAYMDVMEEKVRDIAIAYMDVMSALAKEELPEDLLEGQRWMEQETLNPKNQRWMEGQESEFWERVSRIHGMMMMSMEDMAAANLPRNLEARRRLAFFGNSLFMDVPKAPPVEQAMAFSVLIPHYTEDVRYHKKQLDDVNEDGVSIMYYLKKVFPDEWENCQERFKGGADDVDHHNHLWASFRGQTLARTVRGMMYYQEALEQLARLEKNASSSSSMASSASMASSSSSSSSWGHGLALLKFNLVVASQMYGELKRRKDVIATDIASLMREYPAMKVAYMDEEEVEAGKKKYYSVLVKYEVARKQEVEVYRIQLPGPFKLGEGKPENQNQAIIFTRGEALQAIDMNQENYFEEALKMRNLLEELREKPSWSWSRCRSPAPPPRILGIREHIFTGSVSSLALFMSAQETSFVTLGQRVLADPLRVRMHYGHPDVFDRLWFVSRGGISKASRGINVSEDIYAGFNCTLRGGRVTHHEYIQVGKGRDLGLNQIATFEAKVSGGNGEQTLSRDVHRLGHSLDFPRMTSFYYTSIGFYFNNLLIVVAAFVYMWTRIYLGLSGIEKELASHDLGNGALIASLDQQFVLQIGLLTSVPLLLENSLELGFWEAMWRFLLMQLQLCSVFYTFSMGTKAHYYGRTLLHGGAGYKGTGRGFVVKRESFVRNYCLYSRSHFVKGIELSILLVIYDTYSTITRRSVGYVLTTFSFWFLALSWILGPFLFNPSGFDWLRMVYDYDDFMVWLWQRRGASRKADESWEVWWNQELDHLNSTGLWGSLVEVVLSSRFFLIQYGMVYRLKMAAHNKSILVYLVSWTYVVVAIVVYIVVARAADKYEARKPIYYRSMQMIVLLFVATVIVVLVLLTDFGFVDLFVSMLAFLPTGWGLLCMAAAFKPFLEDKSVWMVVSNVARLYDLAMALIVMVPVAILSWLPDFQSMQTRILFNQAFSRGLQISRILTGKKSMTTSNKTL